MTSVSEVTKGEKVVSGGRKRPWLLIVAGLIGGLLLGWLALRFLPIGPYQFHGMVIQSPEPVANITLTSADGPVSLRDFRGKISLIYFGYTYCPDVCPATLAELAQARRALGKQAEDVQVIMISIDPARDTPEGLAEYMDYFDPSFIGLTGTEEEIAAAAIPLGIFYEKREGSGETDYLMDHTATVAVLDGRGYLRLIYPFDTPGAYIATDLRYLIRKG